MRMVLPSQSTGRLMDDLASDVGTLVESFFGEVVDRGRAEIRKPMAIPMDIDESEDAYLVTLDVPGVPLESIAIDVHEDTLSIAGERGLPKQSGCDEQGAECCESPATTTRRRRERAQGKFERKVKLPLPVEADAVAAELSDGVLVITLPKADPEKGKRRIPVSRA